MNTLKLFTYVKLGDGTEARVPFPNKEEQAEISTYEYSAARMGGAPSITAKISHRFCLDKYWNEKQFVEFNGDKYFVRDTPSSSKNNEDSRYEHDVTFLHERFVLENVYMIDAVQEDYTDTSSDAKKYVSNSTKVVFWGDINEFVARFNACLLFAGLGGKNDGSGYYVVVDEGVSSEELLVSFEDKFFSEALQEILNTFKLPYYWKGKTCHVGVSPEPVSQLFEYGAQNALLSIEKSNTNQGYCNRATGVGSADNIPYYYPNEASSATTKPHAVSSVDGTTGNRGITDDAKIEVINEKDFSSKLTQCLPAEAPWDNYGIIYSGFENSCQFYTDERRLKVLNVPVAWDFDRDWWGTKFLEYVYNHHDIPSDCWKYEHFPQWQHYVTATCNVYDSLRDLYWNYFRSKTKRYELFVSTLKRFISYYLMGTPSNLDILYHCVVLKRGNYARICIPIGYWIDNIPRKIRNFKIEISDENGNHVADLKTSPVVNVFPEFDSVGANLVTIDVQGLEQVADGFWLHVTCQIENYKAYLPNYQTFPQEYIDPNAVYFYTGYEAPEQYGWCTIDGVYYGSWEFVWNKRTDGVKQHACQLCLYDIRVDGIPSRWHDINKLVLGEQRGLDFYGLRSSQTPQDGDRIVRLYKPELSRITVQQRLMPTIYRETEGEKSFYNANNNPELSDELKPYSEFYKDEEGEYRKFEHEYVEGNPRETKFTFEDIKPTIKGIINEDGKEIGQFLDVAFDANDHDFLKGESLGGDPDQFESEMSSDSEYEHPYFFAKLPRTKVSDKKGYSFNLFNSASPDEMTISMTSGVCGGCRFKIMVDEETKKNPVVVDENTGLPKRDKFGRIVVIGTSTAGAEDKYQDIQQNTAANEVWVCLLKETDTYGILMPNANKNLRPKANDTFVLLNIYLPTVYVRDAEDRLSKAIIKAMHEANSEKFNFSIKFSRIYFAENPMMLSSISENSQIKLRYNGQIIALYVSSYSYKVDADEVLPEVTVELSDDVMVNGIYSQNIETDIAASISNIAGGSGIYLIGTGDNTPASDVNAYSALRAKEEFVSKLSDDVIRGFIEMMAGLKVNGGLNADEIYAQSKMVVGQYLRGVVGSSQGVHIGADGSIYARSLYLDETLFVPSIQFNRAMVLLGILIVAPAAGEIEKVEKDQAVDEQGRLLYHKLSDEGYQLYYDDEGNETIEPYLERPVSTTINTGKPIYGVTGWAELKLENGEFGSLAVGDMLLGFWHNVNTNSEEDIDGTFNEDLGHIVRDGNYALRGFSSVYFVVDAIDNFDGNGKRFHYTLRCASDKDWKQRYHPEVGMNFYGFGNMKDKERQSIHIITREYSLRLINKSKWTYDYDNIIEVNGKLDGFAMRAKNRAGQEYIKWFSGYGRVGGNEYIFGSIDQFERVAYRMEIDQSLGGSIAPRETELVSVRILSAYGEDVTERFTRMSVTRTTGDEASDAVWNAEHTQVSNPFEIGFNDLGIDGIHKTLATFYVTATDETNDDEANAAFDYFS